MAHAGEQVARPRVRVFLNYRREDTSGHARLLYDALAAHLGKEQVFWDIDAIEPGVDFVEVVERSVGASDVVIALIGRQWLRLADEQGRRRLETPEDFVRLELECALDQGVRLIPALVQGASMPAADTLPESLRRLASRNAIELSDTRWHDDVGRLLGVIDRIAAEKAPAPTGEQRKTATVLVTDVTGGEELDPESSRRVTARYFDIAKRVVEPYGGSVERFIGDAVVAVFGVPTAHEDDALRAVRVAVELRRTLAELNDELERDYGVRLELRIGVNTGAVLTGSDERLAIGDAVNAAARLQQAAQPGEVLLGAETVRLVGDTIEAEPQGEAGAFAAYRLSSVVRESPSRRLDTPMVGRERERRLLAHAWERACSERACQLFTVLGTAGVGKSRLAADFLDSLEGAAVARGRCLSYGEGITYWPVVEVVKQLRPLALPEEPAIAALLGEREQVSSTTEIAWAFRKLLEAAAPVVCILDDLHWAEPTLLDLVEHVADLSRGAPILLLCLARPELLDERPGWAGGKLNATTVLLEPLAEPETDDLIDHLLAGQAVEPRLRDRIRAAAEGNPLFVEEMLAMVLESPDGEVTVPPTIQALLAARLDRLPSDERDVLSRGSIEGKVFHRGAVEALGPGQPHVLQWLTRLVRKELIRPEPPQLPGEDAFRFRHLLIRDAAYDVLPKATRAELHERFAAWLEERASELVEADELLGYHLEQAYRYRTELGPLDDRARELAARAGRRLAAAGLRGDRRNDLGAALSLLTRALELLPEVERTADLRLVLAEGLFTSGRTSDAHAAAEEAIATASAKGDRVSAMRGELTIAAWRDRTQPEGAAQALRALIADAIPLFEAAGADAALYDAWAAIVHIEHSAARHRAGADAAERAVTHARRAGDRRRELWALTMLLAQRFWGVAPIEAVMALLDEHPEIERVGSFFLEVRGMCEAMLGRFDEARGHIAAGRALAADQGRTYRVAENSEPACVVELLAGDFVAAEREARRGDELLEAFGERRLRSTVQGHLALALLGQGRDEEAERWASSARQLGGTDEVDTLMLVNRARVKIGARRANHAEAERVAREAVALAERTEKTNAQADSYADLAEVLALTGKKDAAADAIAEALARYERKGNLVSPGRARALLVQLGVALPHL